VIIVAVERIFRVLVIFVNWSTTGKSFIGPVDPESHSDERKFSCHQCSKSFKKVIPFLI